MQILSLQAQRVLSIILLGLMVVTRSSHIGNSVVLPDASWAIFFVAGVFLHQRGMFLGLMALSVAIDWFATSIGGVSNYCLTPAYIMMLPTYGVLWFSGRFFARRPKLLGDTLLTAFVIVSLSSLGAELISSGSFYVWNDPTPRSFLTQEIDYWPQMWRVMVGYVFGLGLVAKVLPLIEARISRSSPA